MKSNMLLIAMLVAITSPSVTAAVTEREKVIMLGAVNGAVNGNQQVEVVRALPDPVLFEVSASDSNNIPSYLVVRQVQAVAGQQGEVLLHHSRQTFTASGLSVLFSLSGSARLWVNGQAVNTSWQQRGEDVLIGLPQGAQHISLRSDSPVTLQMPKGYRGEVSLILEVEGWRAEP